MMTVGTSVTVEFYGIPRERAERAQLAVMAGTLKEVLKAVERECPRLDLCETTGAISRHYRVSLDGERFLTDLEEVLSPRSHLLILSADAGG
jgi:hypothetical protein